MNPRMLALNLCSAAMLWVIATPGPAAASEFPVRPVTIVVPFAAGGPTDTIARTIAERMSGSLGQPVIVENVVGAGGSIGVGRVARAAPDGYTVGIGNWSTHVANGAVYSLQYDLLTDLEPITRLPVEPMLIVAKQTMPANNLKELIAWLRANPDRASMGTSGIGGPSHMAGIFFQRETDTRAQLVPYRGAGPAVQDLLAGQIDLMLTGPSVSLALVRAGSIKVFAVTAKSRLAAAPEIPTVDEAGLPGFYFSVWHGLWAPKGTPKDVIAKLNAAAAVAMADSAVRQRAAALGLQIPAPDQQSPEALREYQKAEIEKWWPIIKAAGIRAE